MPTHLDLAVAAASKAAIELLVDLFERVPILDLLPAGDTPFALGLEEITQFSLVLLQRLLLLLPRNLAHAVNRIPSHLLLWFLLHACVGDYIVRLTANVAHSSRKLCR